MSISGSGTPSVPSAAFGDIEASAPAPTSSGEPTGFFQPGESDAPAAPAAPAAAPSSTTPSATPEALSPPPETGEEATDGDLAEFLGMPEAEADGVVATLRSQQFAAPTPAAAPASPAVSDEDINLIIEDLAMGPKAAEAFRKLAKSSPALAAAVASGQPQATAQQPAQATDWNNPIVTAAIEGANESFGKRIKDMGLEAKFSNPTVGKAFADTAQKIARSTNARTQAEFERAMSMALYAIDPEGVKAHYQKEGQNRVKGSLERRRGMLDATQAQTSSPRAGGKVSAEEGLRIYRDKGPAAFRKAIGV